MQPIRLLLSVFMLSLSNLLFAQDVSLQSQKPLRYSPALKASLWRNVKENVTVSFASDGIRYTQDIPPVIVKKTNWLVTGWKNEKIHTQLVVFSKRNINDLKISVSDLLNNEGNIISKDNISTGFVQYVMTDEFKDGCGHRKAENFDSSMVADIINTNLNSINVEKNTTQPVWLTISIPETAYTGNYNGTIKVFADKEYDLKISLNVIDRTLPSPKDWSFQLDYWQHPAAIARVHNLKLWSDEHFEQMRKYYTMLANAGQKIITAAIVDEPWGHQTYDDFPGLIQWTKKKDGTWHYDYSLFDKYIDFVMSCGIKERINCYSMVPW
ncbi:MAG TPA: DUF6067 family protein, partial [Niabella sp.]|nr:DUF6067 family protein [Niabella sp.]